MLCCASLNQTNATIRCFRVPDRHDCPFSACLRIRPIFGVCTIFQIARLVKISKHWCKLLTCWRNRWAAYELDCTQSLFFSLCNWETGASDMHARARDWSERGRRPPHSPRGCASRSLQSLNWCRREKKGTACSLLVLPLGSHILLCISRASKLNEPFVRQLFLTTTRLAVMSPEFTRWGCVCHMSTALAKMYLLNISTCRNFLISQRTRNSIRIRAKGSVEARLHMRFLMRFLVRFRVQNAPYPTLHDCFFFREASRGLERKLSHIISRHPSFQFLLTWRYFVAELRDYKLVRGRLWQVLFAKSHEKSHEKSHV